MAIRERRAPARERILAAADRLFYAEGIHAVGVDRIVAEADVAKASLYSHFRGKDAIVEAYLDGRSGAWREHVEAELPRRRATGRAGVAAVFDLLGEWFAAPGYAGCPFINAAAECGTDGPVGDLTGRHREWVRGLFRRLLSDDQGDLGVGVDALAEQLCLLYDGAMVGARMDGSADAAGHARTAACSLVDSAMTRR